MNDVPAESEMSDRFARLVDPLIALAQVATLSDLEIGTAVSLPAQHDPIALSKQIATLDFLSNGRFVWGVGFGWNEPEFEAHRPGLFGKRVTVVEETIGIARSLWGSDVAEFAGETLRLSPSVAWPKPVRGSVPVLLGAHGTLRNFRRIAAWADGWLTFNNHLGSPRFPDQIRLLRDVWAEAGRQPLELDITIHETPTAESDFRRVIESAVGLGIRRVLLHLADRPMPDVIRLLDSFAAARDTIEGRN